MSDTMQTSPFYFLGRLSAAVALQIAAGGREGKDALEEFMASPLCFEDTRKDLEKWMKGKR